MKLTVLGCGDAFASEGRFNTSFLVEEGNQILIDCGATTLVRLQQLRVDVGSLNTIIITHFHGDHFGGLPFLVLARHFKYNQDIPLTIIGPSGIQDKVYQLQEALYPETSEVIDALGIQFKEYTTSDPLVHEDITIYARSVTHSPPSNPHGVRIEWKNKAFGFSGDTEWNESLVELARDTDLFIIECNNYDKETPGHLSYDSIIQRKELFKTRRLLLTHMGTEVIHQHGLELERMTDGMEIRF